MWFDGRSALNPTSGTELARTSTFPVAGSYAVEVVATCQPPGYNIVLQKRTREVVVSSKMLFVGTGMLDVGPLPVDLGPNDRLYVVMGEDAQASVEVSLFCQLDQRGKA